MQADVTDNMDFATLLEASLAEAQIELGDTVTGTVLSVDSQGLIVGVGPYDGFVSRRDLERLFQQPEQYHVGQEIAVTIARMEDDEGNLVLSVSQATQHEDWNRVEELMQADEVWEGTVADANRGGLIMLFGNLRGFIPASHVLDLPRGLNEDERTVHLKRMVGKTIEVKVIEANRKRRRLVFSQREVTRAAREERKDQLLAQLKEGDVCQGVVSGLRDFGAFVDLGGADGLIHISELAWHRVGHPSEILKVGDKVNAFVLRLDHEGKRIGLSLKRLQPNPWENIESLYHVGQLVEGVVSRTAEFGAFISLEPGIEALLHVTHIADPAPTDATLYVTEGSTLLLRVVSIEPENQRLGLSLKDVTPEELLEWNAKREAALPS